MRGILMLALLLLGACQNMAPGAVDQPSGVIRDLHTGQRLSAQVLVGRLAGAPRLIVGELHDNPDHHHVQLWLLKALAQHRPQGSLLLEMLTPDQQVRVDEVRALNAARWPADLPEALAWESGWDWNLYGPIVRYALAQPYPLLAANLDSTDVRRIYQQAPAVSGARSNAAAVKRELLAQIRDSHCGLFPERRMPAMLAVQQQRDRQMAERLLAAPAPALLFAGAYHARLDIGVPVHVQDLGEQPAPVVVMLVEKGAWISSESADYVWYTATRPVQDYCAQMRR